MLLGRCLGGVEVVAGVERRGGGGDGSSRLGSEGRLAECPAEYVR